MKANQYTRYGTPDDVQFVDLDIPEPKDNEVLVKITSAGTISIPKQFRKYMDVQKGEYVKLMLENDTLVVRKITIS